MNTKPSISDNMLQIYFTIGWMVCITVVLVCVALMGPRRAWLALAISVVASGAAIFLSLDMFDPFWGEPAFREFGWTGIVRIIATALLPVVSVGAVMAFRAYSVPTRKRGFPVE